MALRSLLTGTLALLLFGVPVPALCGQEGVGYYPGGRVQWEYLYQQGEVREARWYDESGRLTARTLYTGGQATASEGYRSDGTLAWRSRILPDEHQEVTRFDPQRRPETRYLLKGNQPDGVSITYYPNGRMRQTVLFRNGILQGPAQAFAEDGHLESEYAYKDGLLDGALRSYAADGRLLVEQNYVAGELREKN